MAVGEVVIPYLPRQQFRAYHDRQARFSKIVAHRRFGKTVGCINDMIRKALENRRTTPPPRYAYVAPTYQQAKDVAWGYLKHYTADIPGMAYSESELWCELPNGARIRLYGADNYDRMRGLYLDGVTIDEPAQIDPRAWPTVIRPALSDYQGWATFIGTPAGRDWFYSVGRADDGEPDPDWLHFTLKASATGILPEEELESARRMLTPEQYAQEYECSFDAAVIGAYYGREMMLAEEEGRITGVPYEPTAQVWTAWDLGVGDSTAIWWCQLVGREIHILDYYEASGVGIDHYVREVQRRSYSYAGHIVPHDAQARELGTGKTRIEMMQSLGMKDIRVCPMHSIEDGINGTRSILAKCWWDRNKAHKGIECLKMYRAEWDEKRGGLKPKPVHDWASHGADAFRYLAMGLEQFAGIETEKRAIDRYRRRREQDDDVSWMVA